MKRSLRSSSTSSNYEPQAYSLVHRHRVYNTKPCWLPLPTSGEAAPRDAAAPLHHLSVQSQKGQRGPFYYHCHPHPPPNRVPVLALLALSPPPPPTPTPTTTSITITGGRHQVSRGNLQAIRGLGGLTTCRVRSSGGAHKAGTGCTRSEKEGEGDIGGM